MKSSALRQKLNDPPPSGAAATAPSARTSATKYRCWEVLPRKGRPTSWRTVLCAPSQPQT